MRSAFFLYSRSLSLSSLYVSILRRIKNNNFAAVSYYSIWLNPKDYAQIFHLNGDEGEKSTIKRIETNVFGALMHQ